MYNAGRPTGQLLRSFPWASNPRSLLQYQVFTFCTLLQTFPHFYTFYLLQLVLIWSRLHSCWKVWGLFWPNIDMWCLCLSWISFVFGGWNGKNDADKVDQGFAESKHRQQSTFIKELLFKTAPTKCGFIPEMEYIHTNDDLNLYDPNVFGPNFCKGMV